jgi:hypothetical protein
MKLNAVNMTMKTNPSLIACCTLFVSLPSPVPVRAADPQGQAIPGPVLGTRMTESYVREIGRFAYFWAWPMVNIHNRLLA